VLIRDSSSGIVGQIDIDSHSPAAFSIREGTMVKDVASRRPPGVSWSRPLISNGCAFSRASYLEFAFCAAAVSPFVETRRRRDTFASSSTWPQTTGDTSVDVAMDDSLSR